MRGLAWPTTILTRGEYSQVQDGGMSPITEGEEEVPEEQEDLQSTKSISNLLLPAVEEVPSMLMWLIAIIIPCCMVLVNMCMILCSEVMGRLETGMVDSSFSAQGLTRALIAKVAFSGTVAAIASALVVLLDPGSAGSGLPELKGYLNGNRMSSLFTLWGHIVRPLSAVLGMSAGLFVGREGPLIVTAGGIGVFITHLLAGGMCKSWVKRDTFTLQQTGQLQRKRNFAYIKRSGCILGCAAGLAGAFNAPVGGVLYMLEETTMELWPKELTFKAFLASTLSVLCTRFLFDKLGRDAKAQTFLIDTSQHPFASHIVEFAWKQVPIIAILGIVGGLLSVAYARCWISVWKLRKAALDRFQEWQSIASIADAVLYTMLCAVFVMLVPWLTSCSDIPSGHNLHIYARYTCPHGQYSKLASLILPVGWEDAVKNLYWQSECHTSRCFAEEALEEAKYLPIAIGVYFVLSVGTAGLKMSTGTFVPNMFLGALMGRWLRQVFEVTGTNDRLGLELAHPGIYAFLGSAAMLAGFSRMSVAIVVLLVELSQNIGLGLGLMVSM